MTIIHVPITNSKKNELERVTVLLQINLRSKLFFKTDELPANFIQKLAYMFYKNSKLANLILIFTEKQDK